MVVLIAICKAGLQVAVVAVVDLQATQIWKVSTVHRLCYDDFNLDNIFNNFGNRKHGTAIKRHQRSDFPAAVSNVLLYRSLFEFLGPLTLTRIHELSFIVLCFPSLNISHHTVASYVLSPLSAFGFRRTAQFCLTIISSKGHCQSGCFSGKR